MRDKKGKNDKGKLDEPGKKNNMKTNGVAENVSYMEWNHSTNLSVLKGQPLEFHHDHSHNKGVDAYLSLLLTPKEPRNTTTTPSHLAAALNFRASHVTTTFRTHHHLQETSQPSKLLPSHTTPPSPHNRATTSNHRRISPSTIATSTEPSFFPSPRTAALNPTPQPSINTAVEAPSPFQFHRTTNHTSPSPPLPPLLPLSPSSTNLWYTTAPAAFSFSSFPIAPSSSVNEEAVPPPEPQLGASSAQNRFASVSPDRLSLSKQTSLLSPLVPIIIGGILLSSIASFVSFRMTRNGKILTKGSTSTAAGSIARNLSQPLLHSCFWKVSKKNSS
ncbi:hypothetical protein PIB30_071685 [Stylosanthes scabra]|uniref:Uncharacterized protein n=1 Tax=Stylosanthes scabra TaxID=79078 RepID=A0ABU6ZML3_9FABA|nr:hypothetical protein [Stylosanthes scabra]